MKNKTINTIELRNLEPSDYPALAQVMERVFAGGNDEPWEEAAIGRLIELFPEGQICVVADGQLVGCALSIRCNYARAVNPHTYQQITGDETFATHQSDGDTLYGVDVFVDPEYRQLRLGRRLYEARKELCEGLNLRAIIFGGRIPKYSQYADELSPREYIEQVKQNQIQDPVLRFQLSNDFYVKRILRNYLKGDHESREYGVLLEWPNIYFESDPDPIKSAPTVVRLGLVQWQNRPMHGFDAFAEHMEFFVDSISAYNADFVLFPEFFSAPLMQEFRHLDEAQAIRGLAGYTEQIVERCTELAISYNVNILAGSMPYVDGEKLHNGGWLCRRDGSSDPYVKIHVTPSETEAWGMTGGDVVRSFETDSGRIGVLVCYDVEFPELGRILAEEGIQILFVPFMTDTQSGYMRVRSCARARAIENECYVAIAGCVGNLPKVNHMDIQYAQSAVFTPSDFAFPIDGIRSEATPNTESTLISDIDLDLLKELHVFGSVRNLKDRRHDLYQLQYKRRS